MSKFPSTKQALIDAGYRKTNSARCSGCHAEIEWWVTPKGAKMPFDPMPADTSEAVSHFATCPHATSFRRRT